MRMDHISTATVVGAGAWGTTMGHLLANKVAKVLLWANEPEVVSCINTRHVNEVFLPGVRLAENLVATNDYAEAIAEARLVLWAIPVQYTRQRIRDCSGLFRRDTILVNLSKGLEEGTWYRPSQVILQGCPALQTVGSLAGANIAAEVSQGKFAEAALAINNHWEVSGLEQLLSTASYRVTLCPDLVALEIASALKNVVAIAAGVCDGLGIGANAKCAIIARGFEEMRLVGRALGANPDSFVSPYAMGDLLVTSFSEKSRNRMLGELLGSGLSFSAAVEFLHGRVAEGVPTSRVCQQLGSKLGLKLPVMDTVYQILTEQARAEDRLLALLKNS